MKIKSITDVITNSSTEVFLLETNKTIEEVVDTLLIITKGFHYPEILTKESGPLKQVYDFGYGYLYDTSKELDIQKYRYSILGISDFHWEWYYQEEELIEDFKEIQDLWRKYFYDHREYINKVIQEKRDWFHPLPDTPSCCESLDIWHVECIPLEFMDVFLKDIWGKPLPKLLDIPEKQTVDYWVGKIGFSGMADNSIPYDTWEEILKNFGGTHFHLG